jgi:hypothetical protein
MNPILKSFLITAAIFLVMTGIVLLYAYWPPGICILIGILVFAFVWSYIHSAMFGDDSGFGGGM